MQDDDGIIEIKTLVSSDTLFTALVDGDHSAYIDQINGALWLLGRKWCDLILWAPDLPSGRLTIVRINRDENAIQALEGVQIAATAGEEGKLFGSVGTRDIAEALTAAGCDTDKAEVRLPDGVIRELGDYEIMIQLHAEVMATINLSVVAE